MAISTMNIHPYCNCHTTGKWQKQDGFSLDPPSGLWVHTRCKKPSKLNYERFVLKLPQIPQPKKPEDIYVIERKYDARREINEELGWREDEIEKEEDEWWQMKS